MKKIGLALIAVVAIVVGYFVANSVISNTVSATVDSELTRMVEAENQKLPKDISQGIRLLKIEHIADSKEITLVYSISNQIPRNRYAEIETETHDRTKSNGDLKKALQHGVKIIHRFENQRSVAMQFETTL